MARKSGSGGRPKTQILYTIICSRDCCSRDCGLRFVFVCSFSFFVGGVTISGTIQSSWAPPREVNHLRIEQMFGMLAPMDITMSWVTRWIQKVTKKAPNLMDRKAIKGDLQRSSQRDILRQESSRVLENA